jgi:hypothetical protein
MEVKMDLKAIYISKETHKIIKEIHTSTKIPFYKIVDDMLKLGLPLYIEDNGLTKENK